MILTYPNKTLKSICSPVKEMTKEVLSDVKKMEKVMARTSNAAGLAANQVGIEKRIVCLNIHELVFMLNPLIIFHSGEKIKSLEQCLSLPGKSFFVNRYEKVVVSYQDLQLNQQEVSFDGFLSKCIQHEIDHLNGILCCDHGLKLQEISSPSHPIGIRNPEA